MARIICDNTDIIDTVQLYPMVLPDHELYVLLYYIFYVKTRVYKGWYSNFLFCFYRNPRVPCRSGIIPMMDFSKWAEPAPSPFHGSAKQFVSSFSYDPYLGKK